jgi:putative ATPase
MQDAQATIAEPVPLHLRNAPTPLMRSMGHGEGYKYDHHSKDHYSGQEHLPQKLGRRTYYVPGELGYEQRIREWMERLRREANTAATSEDA